MEIYEPFLSDGFVSLNSDSAQSTPIKILRDTGASKVEAISDFPVPTSKRQLMRFLGMAGYYRKFCNNFSAIAEPLTNLLGKKAKYVLDR